MAENAKRKFEIPSECESNNGKPATTVTLSHFQPGKIMEEIRKTASEQASKLPEASNSATGATVSSDIPKPTPQITEPPTIEPTKPLIEEPIGTSTKIPSHIPSKTNCILVNPKQKGNPLLKNIRNVPWEFAEMEPDYLMGKSVCALFLSLRYHNLYPQYIHERLKGLGKNYQLRILLVQIDVSDPYPALKDLAKIAILTDCTFLLSWSPEEAGKCIETYKVFENKSPDLIMEKQESETYVKLVDCLSSVKSVNRTDAMTLLSTFGTLERIFSASPEELSLCPGMGFLKAKRLHDVLRQPFIEPRK